MRSFLDSRHACCTSWLKNRLYRLQDGSRAQMYKDASGMMYIKGRTQSSGSADNVFYTLPGQGGQRTPNDNLRYDVSSDLTYRYHSIIPNLSVSQLQH